MIFVCGVLPLLAGLRIVGILRLGPHGYAPPADLPGRDLFERG